MNKQLLSNVRIFLFLSLACIFGQASASSITDFFLEIVGTYEGELSWNEGSTAVTTTIILEGNSISGTSTYADGLQSPFTLIKAIPETRELIVEWKDDGIIGQALFLFSPDYSSFEGTWGLTLPMKVEESGMEKRNNLSLNRQWKIPLRKKLEIEDILGSGVMRPFDLS